MPNVFKIELEANSREAIQVLRYCAHLLPEHNDLYLHNVEKKSVSNYDEESQLDYQLGIAKNTTLEIPYQNKLITLDYRCQDIPFL